MARVILGKENKHPLLVNYINKSDFAKVGDAKAYSYYKEHGGKLSRERYKSVKKQMFTKFMEFVLKKGRRMDVPFFGEVFVQETKVPLRETKNNIVQNNYFITELVLQRYNHARLPMNFYQDIELTLKVDTRYTDVYNNKPKTFTHPYKEKIQRLAVNVKRTDKTVQYTRNFKKHEDYVYPDD